MKEQQEIYRLNKIMPNWYRLEERKCTACGRGSWVKIADIYNYRLAKKIYKWYVDQKENEQRRNI